MSVNVYTPDSTKIIHNTSVDFMTRSTIGQRVHMVQYDNSLPIIAVRLYSNGSPYQIPEGMDVNVRMKKPDKTALYNPVLGCDATRNIVYIEATLQTCIADGEVYAVVEITDTNVVAASGYFYIDVDRNPVNKDDVMSTSEGKAIQQFVNEAQSWAVGGTGTRPGEDEDNSKYYADKAAQVVVGIDEHVDRAKEAADEAAASAQLAKDSETIVVAVVDESKSWAVGGTGTREGEDTDNSKYYYEGSKASQEAAKESEDNVRHDAEEIHDLLQEKVPTLYIDWTTGELLYSGGRLTLWVDEDGFLCWGAD